MLWYEISTQENELFEAPYFAPGGSLVDSLILGGGSCRKAAVRMAYDHHFFPFVEKRLGDSHDGDNIVDPGFPVAVLSDSKCRNGDTGVA